MSQDVHTVSSVAGAQRFALGDRAKIGILTGVANAAGAGAGDAVTVAVTGLKLPPNYVVNVSPGQDARWYITSKTTAGFTVNLEPGIATNTLAAGTFDVAIFA